MWADTEGRVSAPTRKVSMRGDISSVAVREQNLLSEQETLADESNAAVSMIDSKLVRESESSLSATEVHHNEEANCGEVEAGGQAEVCREAGCQAGCLQECQGQAQGQPSRGVVLSGGTVENQEGVYVGEQSNSIPTDVLYCADMDQSTPDESTKGKIGIDSCANVTVRATGKKGENVKKFPKINGTYVEGLLNGLGVTYTVDGAATDTMVSTWIYQQIPEGDRPKLQPGTEDMASGAGGGDIKIWGRAEFRIQLGPVELTREVLVAEIIDDVLLGDDILRRDYEGPMDILNSKKVILFKGQEIPLLQVGLPKRAFRISTLDEEVIPGMTEKVINVYINRPDEAYETYLEDNMLVEPNNDFVSTNRCLVTPTVVRATGRSTTKI